MILGTTWGCLWVNSCLKSSGETGDQFSQLITSKACGRVWPPVVARNHSFGPVSIRRLSTGCTEVKTGRRWLSHTVPVESLDGILIVTLIITIAKLKQEVSGIYLKSIFLKKVSSHQGALGTVVSSKMIVSSNNWSQANILLLITRFPRNDCIWRRVWRLWWEMIAAGRDVANTKGFLNWATEVFAGYHHSQNVIWK